MAMIPVEVNAPAKEATGKSPATPERSIEVQYDFGDSLLHSADMFKEEVVNSYWLKGAIVKIQGLVRGWLRSGVSNEDIHSKLAEYKLGIASSGGPRKSNQQQLADAFSKLPSRQAKLEELQRLTASLEEEEE